jgi:hypothetical protein
MTQAVVTRRDGDVFQARVFWLRAARLLDAEGNVTRVGFESGPRGFDDVWVEYDPPRAPKNQFGDSILVERLQCKWHATGGNYTYQDLTRPEFINAEKTSMLQRAYEALKHDRCEGRTSRLALVTNHRTDAEDPLHGLVRMKSFTLNIDELFKGTTARSATFRIRRDWMNHLGIDEAELRALCISLGLMHTSESLDMLRDRLDDACRLAGLVRPDPRSSATIYDGNIFEWVGQRRMAFDRKTFREKCGDEGLIAQATTSNRVYGIKTFEHALDRLEDRCHDVLNMVPEFDERFVRDTDAWKASLQPRLKAFLLQLPTIDGRLRLAIDAHATLAFAAGAVLDTKSGRLVEIMQRSPQPVVWAPDDQAALPSWPSWEFQEIVLSPDGEGTACAVSITRDTEPMVRLYAKQNLPGVRRLLIAKLNVESGQGVVASGAHANQLAESLADRLKRDREADPALLMERIHLFVSAPNAFTFFLGRHVQVIKPVTLYEFDFGRDRSGSYEPSLSYPDVADQELVG